jgi:hypothetical protein
VSFPRAVDVEAMLMEGRLFSDASAAVIFVTFENKEPTTASMPFVPFECRTGGFGLCFLLADTLLAAMLPPPARQLPSSSMSY